MKKLFSFALALVMVLGLASMAQASSPSIDSLLAVTAITSVVTGETVTVNATTTTRRSTTTLDDYDTPLAGLVIEPVANTPAIEALIAKIQEFLASDPIVGNFFPEPVRQEIAKRLPADLTLDDLIMDELIGMTISAVPNGIGDVVVDMTFATQYRPGQAVVPVIVTFDAQGEPDEFIVLDAEVNNLGVFQATFTEETLNKLNGLTFGVAVLSEP